MTTEKPAAATTPPANAKKTPAGSRLENAGQVVVQYSPAPPKGPADKDIHPRQPLPEVPTAPDKK